MAFAAVTGPAWRFQHFLRRAEDQRRVLSAKSKAVAEDRLQSQLPRLSRDVIQIAFRIRILIIDSRRDDAILQRFDAYDRFGRTGRADQMP